MRKEKFLGVSFLKDEERNVAIKDSPSIESRKTVPLNQMRKDIMETDAEKSIRLSNYKFQEFLNSKGMFNESKEARGIDISDIKVKSGQLGNDLKFASSSLVEGFLSFYGIEMDQALDKYEKRLHLIEDGQQAYIGKVGREGDVTKVSPVMEKEQAIERFNQFEKERTERKEKQLSHEIELEMKKEENR